MLHINEVYGVDISKNKFILMFRNSYICSCLDYFNIRLIDGGSPRVIITFVEMDLENDLTPILVSDNDEPFNILEANWIGGFYAYLHLFLARPTKEIYIYIYI